MDEIIRIDQSVFLFLNNLGDPRFDGLWTLISGKLTWLPLYFIFLYLILKNFNRRSVLYILLFIALGLTISDQLANIFKVGIHRLRPCHTEALHNLMREVSCGGSFGFYSAHASNTFFIASFMSALVAPKIKYFKILVLIWASIVSYSRIYLGVHFPLDIIFGAAIGFLLGGFFGHLSLKTIYRR